MDIMMKHDDHLRKHVLIPLLIFSVICLLFLPAGCSKDSGTSGNSQTGTIPQTSAPTNSASQSSTPSGPTASTSGTTPGQATSQEAIIQQFIADENPDEDVKNILLSGLKEPAPAGTIEKIRGAFSQGTITEEESVLLVMQAAYEPEKLPEQYTSDDAAETGWDITAEAQWIQNNWEQFSAEQQETFRPYHVSPDDPNSIFQQLNASGNRTFLDWILPVEPVFANTDPNRWGTELVSTANYKGIVRVHYYDPRASDAVNDQMQAKAMLVVEAIMKAWPMFKDLLKFEPNIYTDVFLVKFANPKLYGLTKWLSQHNRVEIQINKNLSGKLLQGTTVHELFHCFQFHMSPVYRDATTDISWLMDVTATWSEHFVYPDYNTEHEYLEKYFGKLHQEMVQYNGTTEYERYMFPFFMTQYLGDAGFVYRILRDVKDGADVRMGIMESFSTYHDAFAQYALHNWNQEPWMAYQDVPAFPPDVPNGDAVSILAETKGEAKEYTIPLQKGGIKYQCHAFTQDIGKIQKVKFSFRSINSDNQMRRQALIKIGDVWHLEQWDNLTEREFCRKNADENVKMVILVFSNANLTTTDSSYYKLDTTMACEVRVGGYTRITQTFDGGSVLSLKANYES